LEATKAIGQSGFARVSRVQAKGAGAFCNFCGFVIAPNRPHFINLPFLFLLLAYLGGIDSLTKQCTLFAGAF
jgi:hypothetical protein